jgi:hypothetical protein
VLHNIAVSRGEEEPHVDENGLIEEQLANMLEEMQPLQVQAGVTARDNLLRDYFSMLL